MGAVCEPEVFAGDEAPRVAGFSALALAFKVDRKCVSQCSCWAGSHYDVVGGRALTWEPWARGAWLSVPLALGAEQSGTVSEER